MYVDLIEAAALILALLALMLLPIISSVLLAAIAAAALSELAVEVVHGYYTLDGIITASLMVVATTRAGLKINVNIKDLEGVRNSATVSIAVVTYPNTACGVGIYTAAIWGTPAAGIYAGVHGDIPHMARVATAQPGARGYEDRHAFAARRHAPRYVATRSA